MERRKITSVIVSAGAAIQGVVHLHDLWRTEAI